MKPFSKLRMGIFVSGDNESMTHNEQCVHVIVSTHSDCREESDVLLEEAAVTPCLLPSMAVNPFCIPIQTILEKRRQHNILILS